MCAITVADLRVYMDDGALALAVRHGKGNKHRKIPYGGHIGALALVDQWMHEAGITSGRVFPISPRTVQRVLERAPIYTAGRVIHVRPHDLRRTYARRCYEAGMSVEAIKQNLGHTDINTTLGYIGELDSGHRQPPQIFEF